MKAKWQRILSSVVVVTFAIMAVILIGGNTRIENIASAQTNPTPTPAPATGFDQAAAVANLKAQIKGKENDLTPTVFKNIQTPILKSMPAARLLAVMEFGYSRALGVNCTHCHVPDKWESDDKPQKQITRDMVAMSAKINGELLKNIKNLKDTNPVVNCTTCHRGQVIPATNLPPPPKTE